MQLTVKILLQAVFLTSTIFETAVIGITAATIRQASENLI